jgi:hypothetical protein
MPDLSNARLLRLGRQQLPPPSKTPSVLWLDMHSDLDALPWLKGAHQLTIIRDVDKVWLADTVLKGVTWAILFLSCGYMAKKGLCFSIYSMLTLFYHRGAVIAQLQNEQPRKYHRVCCAFQLWLVFTDSALHKLCLV